MDALAGVRVHLAGDYDCHAVNGAFSSGRALRRLLRRRYVQDLPHPGPEIPVVLALEPGVDVGMQRFPEVGKLREVVLCADGGLELVKTAVEYPAQRFTGGAADHGNVHGDQKPLEGGVPAPLDGFPEIAP